MEQLVSRMETLEKDIRSNFNWLLALFIGGFAGLCGIIAKGFGWF
jgi:hypothetical protein